MSLGRAQRARTSELNANSVYMFIGERSEPSRVTVNFSSVRTLRVFRECSATVAVATSFLL